MARHGLLLLLLCPTTPRQAANAHDFILKFHDAYATDVGQKGGQVGLD